LFHLLHELPVIRLIRKIQQDVPPCVERLQKGTDWMLGVAAVNLLEDVVCLLELHIVEEIQSSLAMVLDERVVQNRNRLRSGYRGRTRLCESRGMNQAGQEEGNYKRNA